ncbi:MAG TPA: CocE/NonD family hydrolase, partial [Burkholderiales bacterium]|nr:CocE/NonD family hydrolase [Burkholderiales bacterium]
MAVDPERIRCIDPQVSPQYPFDEAPRTPERSEPRYAAFSDYAACIPMRDNVRLAADVNRPSARGMKFPALVTTSVYTRQLQRGVIALGQNEAGISEFWVPRGYAHVIVDVRGSNDSEGHYDLFGAQEQQDLYDIIEWVAAQPWCDGNVGMSGVSYMGRSQLFAAEQQPPHLKAIFPYDASCDFYRDACFHGGIPTNFTTHWTQFVMNLHMTSGRNPNVESLKKQLELMYSHQYPFDGPFYRERSAGQRLDKVKIPSYFGCGWYMNELHLKGAFDGYNGTGAIPKRMMVGPRPWPLRPWAGYHYEMLRWYDHWLKGMDTRVMEGAPIRLYIHGDERWREEKEWPLARTLWKEFYLGGPANGREGKLLDAAGPEQARRYEFDGLAAGANLGEPRLIYRTEPMAKDMELTGPVALYLNASSTAPDVDWLVYLVDEAPDGKHRELCKGWLRSSHRKIDPAKSTQAKPYHPHLEAEPLAPGTTTGFPIEIWPVCNVFKAGHRIRLEIANSDSMVAANGRPHVWIRTRATNTIHEGGSEPSRLVVPVIPR